MYLRILKPDKTEFQGHNCCSIINNEIVINTDVDDGEQILSCAGKNICELHLTDEDYKTLTTWDFVIDVAPRVHTGEGIQSSDTWDMLDTVLEDTALFKSLLEAHVDNKENPHEIAMAQLGMDNVENKSSEMIRAEITKDNVTTALGYTPYTPTEVDNKISALESSLDWKETVATYDELLTTYANPEKGWTVNVGDENNMTTYRYDGSEWVDIGVTAIPKATESNDGLMSKEDKAKLEELSSGGGSGEVTGVKGDAETTYRKGNINITAENIGLGNVDNTADEDKHVKYAESAGSATKATQDGNGNNISDTYATKGEVLISKTAPRWEDPLSTYTTTGVYHIPYGGQTDNPTTTHGTLFVDSVVGTLYQLWISDSGYVIYKRISYDKGTTWQSWSKMDAGKADSAINDGNDRNIAEALGRISGTTWGAAELYSGDLNDITKLSIYNVNGTTDLNSPVNAWGFVLTFPHNYSPTTHRAQLWLGMTTGLMYWRYLSGSWSEWYQLAHRSAVPTGKGIEFQIVNGKLQYRYDTTVWG